MNQPLPPRVKTILRAGGVFVPSPLALDKNLKHDERYQRLLTLYYIRAGAKAVIPGAHTGEFALNDLSLLNRWMQWIKEMTSQYGEQMITMAMIGGSKVLEQAELAVRHGYDAVMIAPTAFKGLSENGVIQLVESVAAGIPTFGFELQRAIPGSYTFTAELWSRLFDTVYGAKGASFDTYRSLVMLEAAARSSRVDELILFTGNDDRIVADLIGIFPYQTDEGGRSVSYQGGLLGHFATDTRAAVNWVGAIKESQQSGSWNFTLSKEELAHAVNRCNMALFDALGNFENSVWGVKYRLTSMGLLPGPYCMHEKGRKGQDKAIDQVYSEYRALNDHQYMKEQLDTLKKEVGIV